MKLVKTKACKPTESINTSICQIVLKLLCAQVQAKVKERIVMMKMIFIVQQLIIASQGGEQLQLYAYISICSLIKMRISLVVLFFLIVLVHNQSNDGVFAFSWLAGHCQYEVQTRKEQCDPNLISLWDNQSFTIHGMWPSTNTTNKYGNFNLKYFEKNLRLFDDMQNYWPAKSKASSTTIFLWDHQWSTHGQDYSAIIYRLRPDQFTGTVDERNEKLQVAYFNEAINFYKKFSVKKLPTGNFTKAQFASLMGLNQNQFIFVCLKANLVRQVQVCYETTKTGNVIKNCTKTTSTCTKGGETIQLLSFAFKKQDRVFEYPKQQLILTSQ